MRRCHAEACSSSKLGRTIPNTARDFQLLPAARTRKPAFGVSRKPAAPGSCDDQPGTGGASARLCLDCGNSRVANFRRPPLLSLSSPYSSFQRLGGLPPEQRPQ